MRIVKSGKIEEGTKVEKMPGRAGGKGEEILGKRGDFCERNLKNEGVDSMHFLGSATSQE